MAMPAFTNHSQHNTAVQQFPVSKRAFCHISRNGVE